MTTTTTTSKCVTCGASRKAGAGKETTRYVWHVRRGRTAERVWTCNACIKKWEDRTKKWEDRK